MKALFIALMIMRLACAQVAWAENTRPLDWYIETYGEINDRERPSVQLAADVMRQLWQASAHQRMKEPRLAVLTNSATRWVNSWAFSLPDRSVVLVEDLLDLIEAISGSDEAMQKGMFGFIIGHEMAHIRLNHHQMGTPLFFKDLSSPDAYARYDQAEQEADIWGLLTMTAAGLDPAAVVSRSPERFFQVYQQKVREKIITRGWSADSQAEDTERAVALASRLRLIVGQIPLFQEGIALYQEQRYADAADAFKRFYQVFPGREVAGNIGAALLKLAESEVTGCQEWQTQLRGVVIIDFKTLASRLAPEGIASKKCDRGQRYQSTLTQAKWYLEEALTRDPSYWPAKNNLALAHYFVDRKDTASDYWQKLYEDPISRRVARINLRMTRMASEQSSCDQSNRIPDVVEATRNDAYQQTQMNNRQIFEKFVCQQQEKQTTTEPRADVMITFK